MKKESSHTELLTLLFNIQALFVMLVILAVPIGAQIAPCSKVTRLGETDNDQSFVKVITPGECISRRIAGKKVHLYSLELAGGQFIYTEVNQGGANGID